MNGNSKPKLGARDWNPSTGRFHRNETVEPIQELLGQNLTVFFHDTETREGIY